MLSVKNTVFWDVTLWTLVYRCHISKESAATTFRIKESSTLKMQLADSSETMVHIHKIIRYHMSEDGNLHRSSALKEGHLFCRVNIQFSPTVGTIRLYTIHLVS